VDAEQRYIYPASSSGTALNPETTKSHALTITFNNGVASISNNGQYFYYSTNSSWFSSTNKANSVNTALYKLDDGQPKARNLAFSQSAISVNIWGEDVPFILNDTPVLSGKKIDDVVYSSSDENVATVVPTTGEVTIRGLGETIITASAEATSEGTTPAYLADAVSYTISVNSVQPPYYTKINSRDDLPGTSQTSATGDYLFVYENGTKAYVFKAICDGTPTGAGNTNDGHVELTKTGSAIEVDLTENGILATDAVKACKIQLAHHTTATRNDWTIKPASLGTYWVRVYNNGTNVRLLAMTSAGYSATFTFDGTGNNAELKRTDSSGDAYWTYNATNNCFEGTSTASKISIYKLSE
jgi:hypothetical protein